jgi:hypothetical protein
MIIGGVLLDSCREDTLYGFVVCLTGMNNNKKMITSDCSVQWLLAILNSDKNKLNRWKNKIKNKKDRGRRIRRRRNIRNLQHNSLIWL